MTKILYCEDLEEYIRTIIKQEILGEYENYIIRLNEKKYLKRRKKNLNK